MRSTSGKTSILRAPAAATAAVALVCFTLQAAPVHAIDAAAVDQHAKDKDEPRGRERRAPRQEARPQPPQQSRQVPGMASTPGGMQPPQAPLPVPMQAQQPPSPRGFENRAPPPSRGFNFRGPAPTPQPPRGFDYRAPPPPRVVQRLPPGHREYYWGGSPYYHSGGRWYRPYGSSFTIVAAPFGLFVPYLPSYYSTVWIGGTRYYVADDTYYLYDQARRGYIVTRSPYAADRDDDDDRGAPAPASANELFVYPTRGQSEQQQADDRYECHRWAVDQSHYDPTTSEYRVAERAEYDRALTACLTGRGYSVK